MFFSTCALLTFFNFATRWPISIWMSSRATRGWPFTYQELWVSVIDSDWEKPNLAVFAFNLVAILGISMFAAFLCDRFVSHVGDRVSQ